MRVATRVLALIVALLVLAGGAGGREHYLCHMSGRVQSGSCCCGAARALVGKSHQKTVRSEDCCERVAPSERTVVAAPRADVQPSELAALVATLPEPRYLPPPVREGELIARPGRGPPVPKQPLYAVHCAYLC